jgi:purine-binding chemotaxis protein CheW
MVAVQEAVPVEAREMLSFFVGEQSFCIDIMVVREIRGWSPAVRLPHAPPYVRGVVNLRGAALPILDLADRLGFPPDTPTAQHVVIVAEIGSQVVGLLVTAVSDILAVSDVKLQPTPEIVAGSTGAFLQGLLNIDGRMFGLLRLDQLAPQLEPLLEAA